MEERIRKLLKELRQRVEFDRHEVVAKGHSDAVKLALFREEQPVNLLRIYRLDTYSRRKNEHDFIKRHFTNGVRCQEPIALEAWPELQLCGLLLTYLEGASGEVVLPGLSSEEQYLQGEAAGKELRTIHTVVPDAEINGFERRYAKYLDKKRKVGELGLRFHKQSELEAFIERSFGLLRDSPVCFQHDDYHPSNLIFRNGRLKGVIDFSRFDWGDPWEEFFKLPKYTCAVSRLFAAGQISGYFDGKIPDRFWEKYNLFVALNQHATLLGSSSNGKVQQALEKIESTIEGHDFAGGGPPIWFRETSK